MQENTMQIKEEEKIGSLYLCIFMLPIIDDIKKTVNDNMDIIQKYVRTPHQDTYISDLNTVLDNAKRDINDIKMQITPMNCTATKIDLNDRLQNTSTLATQTAKAAITELNEQPEQRLEIGPNDQYGCFRNLYAVLQLSGWAPHWAKASGKVTNACTNVKSELEKIDFDTMVSTNICHKIQSHGMLIARNILRYIEYDYSITS